MIGDVRAIDPMRVSGNEHHGSTVVAATEEGSQYFFQQFFSDRRDRLYKKSSEAAADTSNVGGRPTIRALSIEAASIRKVVVEHKHLIGETLKPFESASHGRRGAGQLLASSSLNFLTSLRGAGVVPGAGAGEIVWPVRGQIHRLVNRELAVATPMENRLKDVAVAIGDISVLPVEADGVSAAVPMPEP